MFLLQVGKSYGFMVKIQSARGLPRRIDKSSFKYSFFNGKEVSTPLLSGSNPSFGYEQVFNYKTVTPELADYLLNSNLCITLMGTQKARSAQTVEHSSRGRLSTTETSDGKSRPRKKRPSSHTPKVSQDRNKPSVPNSDVKTTKPKKHTSKSRRPKKPQADQ
ncbi:unnamed protein product [Nippostrongylus brasiliensis]|uniref:HORMA domain-containing protein n=1 Tax=Nippostrongylus brasiliensis TaxID=27835 RepID=A0A0N4Y703_NIPBR|nr:unnamed protein product [Nippostrongylus brasiliensis]